MSDPEKLKETLEDQLKTIMPENEDPQALEEKVKKQIVDQLHEMDIDVKEYDNVETVQQKLTTVISEELKNFGVNVESAT